MQFPIKINREHDIFPRHYSVQPDNYLVRRTVKAIVFDDSGKIALLANRMNDYLLLPGGGVEKKEIAIDAIERECREEICCGIEIQGSMGTVIDLRDRTGEKCITHCYFGKAKRTEPCDDPTATEKEIGQFVLWLDVDQVRDAFARQVADVETGQCVFYNTAFNIVRDAEFLKRLDLTNA